MNQDVSPGRGLFYRRGLVLFGVLCISIFLLISAAAAGPEAIGEQFCLADIELIKAEKEYGFAARQRLNDWVLLIRTDRSMSDREKLEKVNTYFNRFTLVDDETHWGTDDYWATPVEFVASEGGDCEDFSFAKFFTLKAMGVNERRLNLTYVKDMDVGQAHMVLTYFEVPGEEPLILDNLVEEIQPASMRPELLPVYSFNGTGLWVAKSSGQGELVGTSDLLRRWKELIERMPDGFD